MAFLISSCSPNKAQEQQGEVEIFRSEVMHIHDEVMPSMGSLMNLQKQLKEKIIKTTSKEQVDKLLHDIEVLLEENKKE